MPTINQLICHGREFKWCTQRTLALTQCPQKQGVCLRISTRTPKKPRVPKLVKDNYITIK
jgi:small subunit ribosomal protein S12